MREKHYCENCYNPIEIGQDYFLSGILLDGKAFCSKRCLKEWVLDNKADEIVEEWIDDNVEEYTMESDDPYDRYGVSPGDF